MEGRIYGDEEFVERPEYDERYADSDEREPVPFDPAFDDPPEDSRPPPDDGSPDEPAPSEAYLRGLRRRARWKINRGLREARSYLALAWTMILLGLTPEQRAILRRWFPGANDDVLRAIARNILAAHDALGTATVLFFTRSDADELDDLGDPDADFHLNAYYPERRAGSSEYKAQVIWRDWEGTPRPSHEWYIAGYEAFVEADPFPASTMVHEGIHLTDPASVRDNDGFGTLNNAYRYQGFVAELTGMPFDRAETEAGAGI